MTLALAPIPLATNFLVPNGTFFAELVAFGIILFLLARYVIPPINRAMTARQEAIRQEFTELQSAREDARKTEEAYRAQLSEARHEAAKIREEAREQGVAIIAELRQQAQQEAERIQTAARAQIAAERQQAVASLRGEVGSLATALASRIVGEALDDDERSRRVVDRFLEDLETLDDARVDARADGTDQ